MKNTITKLAFFTALIFAFALKSNAQWREADVDGMVTNFFERFKDIKYENKETIFGTTNNGEMYKSENGNNFYKVVIGSDPFNQLNSFSAINDSLLYVIKNGNLYKTINGGTTWDTIAIHNQKDTVLSRKILFALFFNDLNGFVFSDTSDGCLEIWTTSDGANSWKRVNCSDVILSDYYKSIYYEPFTNTFENGCALIFNKIHNDVIFKITDYGNHWEEIKIGKEYQFTGMVFKDSLNGTATRKVANNNNIATTKDGGKTWDTTSVGTKDKRVSEISYAKETTNKPAFYICGGNPGFGSKDPNDFVGSYVSFDDGKTWKQLDQLNHHQIEFYNAEIGISTYYKQDANPFPIRFFEGLPYGFSGIKNSENQASVLVYPNPTKEAFFVEIESNSSIEIYDIQGKLCKKVLGEKGKIQVKTDELKSGTYFIKITDQKNTFNQKLMITE